MEEMNDKTMSCCNGIKRIWISGVKYATAVAKWIQAGKPTRNAKEIRQRFLICESCPHFERIRPWRGRCKVCGCYLGRHGHRLLEGNKIAMKTELCPEGKWS